MPFSTSPLILITDDDPHFRETLSELFLPRGFKTLLASDGEEALDIVTSQDVHLLLLDNNMPRLTGLETLRRVKQINAQLPCILLSARMDDVLREQAQQAQAFSVLPKPVSRGDLTSAVDHALRMAYGW
jgi:two-component system, response regulator PdtaR